MPSTGFLEQGSFSFLINDIISCWDYCSSCLELPVKSVWKPQLAKNAVARFPYGRMTPMPERKRSDKKCS